MSPTQSCQPSVEDALASGKCRTFRPGPGREGIALGVSISQKGSLSPPMAQRQGSHCCVTMALTLAPSLANSSASLLFFLVLEESRTEFPSILSACWVFFLVSARSRSLITPALRRSAAWSLGRGNHNFIPAKRPRLSQNEIHTQTAPGPGQMRRETPGTAWSLPGRQETGKEGAMLTTHGLKDACDITVSI